MEDPFGIFVGRKNCSVKCSEENNRRLRSLRMKTLKKGPQKQKKCRICGKEFTLTEKNRVLCSTKCARESIHRIEALRREKMRKILQKRKREMSLATGSQTGI